MHHCAQEKAAVKDQVLPGLNCRNPASVWMVLVLCVLCLHMRVPLSRILSFIPIYLLNFLSFYLYPSLSPTSPLPSLHSPFPSPPPLPRYHLYTFTQWVHFWSCLGSVCTRWLVHCSCSQPCIYTMTRHCNCTKLNTWMEWDAALIWSYKDSSDLSHLHSYQLCYALPFFIFWLANNHGITWSHIWPLPEAMLLCICLDDIATDHC